MLRQFGITISAVCAFAVIGSAGVAADGYTTRIETRPTYGAVVSVEQGVRVFRPLPPVRQVIINPGRTPLSLGFNETRVYGAPATARVYERGGASYSDDGGVYSAPLYGRRFGPRHGHGRSGHSGHGHHRSGHGGGVQMR